MIHELSKNDWKPITEFINLRSFALAYKVNERLRYEAFDRRDESEDGMLFDLLTSVAHPAELVTAHLRERAAESARSIKSTGVAGPYESYGPDVVTKVIRDKEDKKYSDVKDRILVINADLCIPIAWTDKWQSAFDYANRSDFHAIYAIQHDMDQTSILTLKGAVTV